MIFLSTDELQKLTGYKRPADQRRWLIDHGWSGLSTRDEAAAAVGVLIEYDWIREQAERTSGRTRTVYEVNSALVVEGS